MSRALDQVLADVRGDAAVLKRAGHQTQAERELSIAERVAQAQPEYLTWLSETAAMEYSNRSAEWLKARFVAWETRDLAYQDDRGRRFYRRCVLEHRGNAEAARAAGRRAAVEGR